MTHDELMVRIYEDEKFLEQYFGGKFKGQSALRAVVELHKPINNPNFPDSDIWCWQCADGRGYAKYPCPTIQTIEKELG